MPMGNYNRDRRGRPGGERGFERRGFSGRDSGGPAQMFQATCDKCRMNCEVPFRPTNDRQMFEAVCDECHNNCRVPFRPTSGKPIYCSNCFGDKKESPRGDKPQSNDQFKDLHAKLDQILGLLTPDVSPVPVEVEQVMEEVVEIEKPARKKSSKKKE